MSSEPWSVDEELPLEFTRQIDFICDEFEAAMTRGEGVSFEKFLERVDTSARQTLMKELMFLALGHLRQEENAKNPIEDLISANPGLARELRLLLNELEETSTVLLSEAKDNSTQTSGLAIRCPHCHNSLELVIDASLVDIYCPNCGNKFSLASDIEDTRGVEAVTRVAHFDLIERLGMGEFGTVWKARDTILDRTVALKIPRRQQLDAASIDKFMREARAAARLHHPNIITTHEVGRHGDTLYIVNDYIRGTSLGDVLTDHRLSTRDAVDIATTVADALEHAHLNGVIHRDLKPSNILIDDDGQPHLMDFGLAKRKEMEVTVTADGAILGTPAYMSPEQARGEAAHVDGRSDVYSLGVLLFQLLTGELPFRGSLQVVLQKVINQEPPALRTLDSQVPKDLETICLKCLEKDAARRYATAAELAADLRRYMQGRPIAARRIGAAGHAWRWARRNPAISVSLATTMLTLFAAALTSSYLGWHAAQSAALADRQATEVRDILYESLLQEIRLTSEVRKQGYGEEVEELVLRAKELDSTKVDPVELRRQLVRTMGDFVAYWPIVIKPSEGVITSLCMNQNGTEIFVGFEAGHLRSYDTATREIASNFTPFSSQVTSIAITDDNQQLIAVDQTGMVRRWRRAALEWQHSHDLECGANTTYAYLSSKGEYVAALNESTLTLWDLLSGKRVNTFNTEAGRQIRNVAFDLVHRRLAAAYSNADADTVGWLLWDLDTGEVVHHVEKPSQGNSYENCIDFAADGKQLAIGFDEVLEVYELGNYQVTYFYGIDATKAVAFSPTNSFLVASNIRGQLTMWNSATNRQVAALHHLRQRRSTDDLVFSSDGEFLASSNADTLQIWDLSKADEKTEIVGHEGGIPCAAFSPQGFTLASGSKDDSLRFWDPSTGRSIRTLEIGEAVEKFAFSPDGTLLAVGSVGRTDAPHLRIIDVESGEVLHEARLQMGNVHSLAWAEAKDTNYLAGCGAEGVALWTLATTQPAALKEVFHLDREWCLATAITSNARLMVWVEDNSQLRAWDIEAGSELPFNASPMLQGWHGIAFLPGGESIIYISKSGVAEIWNVRENRRIDSLGEAETFGAPHIALSPDGKRLAALSEPDVVSVWHVKSKQHMFSLRPTTGTVWSLAWDPSGDNLAVGQSDWGLAVWHLPRVREKLAEAGLPWPDDE